jgi:hypothetical protein
MFMTNAARNTLTVMGEQGIRRIVVTSAQGAGDDWAQLNSLFKAFINLSNVKASYEDHHVSTVSCATPTSTGPSPAHVALTDKPIGGDLRTAESGTEKPGTWINRADLAKFLLDEVEFGAWTRKAPLVWNDRG